MGGVPGNPGEPPQQCLPCPAQPFSEPCTKGLSRRPSAIGFARAICFVFFTEAEHGLIVLLICNRRRETLGLVNSLSGGVSYHHTGTGAQEKYLMKFHPRIILGLLVLLVFPAMAQARVYEYLLDNGMKVLVKPDRRSPVVVQQVWYKVGSSYEHGGITGISHMLEHMLFKGTEKYPAGEFSRIIAANGGRENAFTGPDYTAYFQRLEKSRLGIAMKLESDRMRNAALPADEFLKERDVVAEERRLRTDDNPQARAYEQFRATAFVNSPYHHSVIGWMTDIENYSLKDVRLWYESWYAPNNATLVVAGDVEPEEVLMLAKQYYEPIDAEQIAQPKPRTEVPQYGERRISIKLPATIEYILMGYKTPTLKTADNPDDVYALEVLAWILDGGGSSRLTSELLRDRQLISRGSLSYNPHGRLQTLFTLSAIPAGGVDVAEVEAALREQIERLKKQPVSEEELNRAQTQILADRTYQKDSVFYQAMQLGTLETVGIGWQADEVFDQKIKDVTAEQIMYAAKTYLNNERLTVTILHPQPIPGSAGPKVSVAPHIQGE